jgi:thiamine pyrophosphate-dependent acetolactate synthase large subunit-like protein
VDHQIHNGWSMDHQGLPPVDLMIAADPDATAGTILHALGPMVRKPVALPVPALHAPATGPKSLGIEDLAAALRHAVTGRDASLTHVSLSWQGTFWHIRHPLDYLGSDGGGGVGGGPGISVGAALALKGSGRLPVAVCGDGDFLMGCTAIWTAVHYRIPLLIVVANNRSFYNDEVHQERVALQRGRPVENKWIGQKMIDPDIDIAAMARAQGARGFGPVAGHKELGEALAAAVAAVQQGDVVVVDVRIEPGYGARDSGDALARA